MILPACNKRKPYNNGDSEVWDQAHIEARLYDVPILIGAKSMHLLNSSEKGDNAIVAYASTMSIGDSLAFYQEHMERFGWRQIACFMSSNEILLNFEKPQKYCSISLRWLYDELHVVIFNGQKIVIEK